jgi:histidinol-phosphate phosphatase family protein
MTGSTDAARPIFGPPPPYTGPPLRAVLFDRDGTLIEDVPYNGDPNRVTPMPGARAALDRLRAAGLQLGVITNQSAVGRGLLTADQVAAVNHRVEELLGPFDTWHVCPHDAYDGCDCRKPAPGMVLAASGRLGVPTTACVVIGDIGADMAAAAAAAARAVLVPTPATRIGEIAAAPAVVGDLDGAVRWILGEDGDRAPVDQHRYASAARPAPPGRNVLAVRADSAGDVLMCGPAIRAIAARAGRVTLLCGPRGEEAARLLPGVNDVAVWPVPWIDASAPPVDAGEVESLVKSLRDGHLDEAVVFTSFHQSPLPMALLLRLAGVDRISAVSDDWPGSLLTVRHRVPAGIPEAERAVSLATAAGYPLPTNDDGRLRVGIVSDQRDPRRVVVHPGASVPARAAPPELFVRIVERLHASGFDVVVTGGTDERDLTAHVAAAGARDLGGRTRLDDLARLVGSAGALVVANTGPAHLAAATGTPVVSLFAPTVPYAQWGPYGVPSVRLGDPLAPCAGSRATVCPVPGHPCLGRIDADDVVAAVRTLTGVRA